MQSAIRARCASDAEPPGTRLRPARALLGSSGMELFALAVAFFALSWALVVLCERLLG